jgi:trimeric autotransporter adhesin
LNGLGAGSFWNVIGNAGTSAGLNFLGTVDNQPLELHVNSQRALRLEPDADGAPNLMGGAPANFVDAGTVGAVIAGGGAMSYGGSAYTNEVASDFGAIGGGAANTVWPQSPWGTIGGGYGNIAGGTNSTIAGGTFNFVGGTGAFIGGGLSNQINLFQKSREFYSPDSSGSTIGGGVANVIRDGDSYFLFGNLVAPAGFNTVGGGGSNTIDASSGGVTGFGNTIAGGMNNFIQGAAINHTIGGGYGNYMGSPDGSSGWCVIAGGYQNSIAGGESYDDCTISGGSYNSLGTDGDSFESCTIAGGTGNYADGYAQTIAGGSANSIEGIPFILDSEGCALGGGESNLITRAQWATISGGFSNLVSGDYATVTGGFMNVASGAYSLAAGNKASATNQGAFVWGDSTAACISSTAANQFTVRASGGVRFFSNAGATAGVSLAPGSGSWTTLSDRNSKENLQPVDTRSVLDKVAALPMNTWNYKTQDAAIRHIGPMAQDFKAAFAVGETDTGIATVDEGGVALAAIQGLNQKLEEKDAEIQDLKESVAQLRKMVQTMSEKQ